MSEFDGECGVLIRIGLEVEVKRAYPLSLYGIVEVGLFIELATVHEFMLYEAIVIE